MSELKLILPKRTPPQKRLDESTKRFNLSVWGRQSGKTTFGVRKMLWKPLQKPEKSIYWYVLQTYSTATIAFERYDRLIFNHKELYKYRSESELRFELLNGQNVFFKSGEVLENLRAETLDGVIIDELRQQKKELWGPIIRPMLAKHKGWADLLTTPNGFDWVYDLKNEIVLKPDEWGYIQAPSTEAWWWTPEEIESVRSTMSEAEFAQEIMAEFRDLTSGKAYVTFGEHNLRTSNPFWADGMYHPMLPVVVAMDFNLNPMAWTLMQKRIEDFYAAEEIWLKNSHTPEAAKELVKRLMENHPNIKKVGVVIAGDATSKAGQRAAAGQSDYDIVCMELDAAGIPWVMATKDSNPSPKDRVNNVNAKCKDANGSVHFWLHPTRCPNLRRDFERVVWKEGASSILDQTTDKTLTHASDGVGYAMWWLSPLTYKAEVPALRIIKR